MAPTTPRSAAAMPAQLPARRGVMPSRLGTPQLGTPQLGTFQPGVGQSQRSRGPDLPRSSSPPQRSPQASPQSLQTSVSSSLRSASPARGSVAAAVPVRKRCLPSAPKPSGGTAWLSRRSSPSAPATRSFSAHRPPSSARSAPTSYTLRGFTYSRRPTRT